MTLCSSMCMIVWINCCMLIIHHDPCCYFNNVLCILTCVTFWLGFCWVFSVSTANNPVQWNSRRRIKSFGVNSVLIYICRCTYHASMSTIFYKHYLVNFYSISFIQFIWLSTFFYSIQLYTNHILYYVHFLWR